METKRFKDVHMQEKERRMQGAYYTPLIWVEEAHKYIESTFGKNWKDEYTVWDPACGTGNLTYRYDFKELYLSTLENEDIEYGFLKHKYTGKI